MIPSDAETPDTEFKSTTDGLDEKPSLKCVIDTLISEEKRRSVLKTYKIIDTDEDFFLKDVVWMTTAFFSAPISLISFIDSDRQWFSASQGIDIKETSRDISFCSLAIETPNQIMVVEDAQKDERFRINPYVTGSPGIRFYAGVPLLTPEKAAIGVLCVIDTKPRTISPEEHKFLSKMGCLVMERLDSERLRLRLNNFILKEHNFYSEVLKISSETSECSLSLQGVLARLVSFIDQDLGWLSIRTQETINGLETVVRNSPLHQEDGKIRATWSWIDSQQTLVGSKTSMRSISPQPDTRYYLITIPVNRNRKNIARIEILFPYYSLLDERIRNMLEILADHISILAERELLIADASHKATHDELTGLAGRQLILSTIKEAIKECDPLQPDSVILFFDLDGFKDVNDSFGHDTGDRLLKEVSARLRGVCREKDLLGRLSGDEFILVARAVDVDEGLPVLLQRIMRHVAFPYTLGDLEIRLHASMGCTVITEKNIPASELLKRSEEAMYRVKIGENKDFCIADNEMIIEINAKRTLERNVKKSIGNNGLFPLFQPIIDLRTGNICGSETLMRLRCKDGSTMTAGDFLPVIQGTRFLLQLDEQALAETIRHYRTEKGKEFLSIMGFRFTVNASPILLLTKGYAQHVLQFLSEASIAPSSLILEITETSVLPNDSRVMKNLRELREKGVGVALDDFGSGFSNLLQLVNLPIDIIKIDKTFMKGITTNDPAMRNILDAILGIGESLNYEIYAEGIEEERQATFLMDRGCHRAQGYHLGKPMPFEELVQRFGATPKAVV